MTKRTLTYILVLMAISLLGIGLLQWIWLDQAIAKQTEDYDSRVQIAMNQTVRDMEESEAAVFIEERFGETIDIQILLDHTSENIFFDIDSTLVVTTDVLKGDTETVTEVFLWSESDSDQVRVIADGSPQIIRREYTESKTVSGDTLIHTDEAEHRIAVIGDVMERMIVKNVHAADPLEFRMQSTNLDSLLSSNLHENGVKGEFDIGVSSEGGDSLLQSYSQDWVSGTEAEYAVSLFPYMDHNGPQLLLSIPDKSAQILGQLSSAVVLSILLAILVLGTFAFTLFQIIRQKRISQIKSDFINNMTHEFKTPLATIGLAADSISHPKVKNDTDQIDHFTQIIREEKSRLNDQVEKVLQIARMERGELKLKSELIDFNKLVTEAAENMKLQVQAKSGELTVTLDAGHGEIKGDKAHLYNVILNLIDNALKYSHKTPHLKLTTRWQNGEVQFHVADNGIGMSRDEQKRIFETFYRGQTGNVHSTKGFGLGLSYVREIVKLHHGQLNVDSTPGMGSTIGFSLPI